jgi:hypothetical protein
MKTRKQGTQRKEEWWKSSTQKSKRDEKGEKTEREKNRMKMLILLEELK